MLFFVYNGFQFRNVAARQHLPGRFAYTRPHPMTTASAPLLQVSGLVKHFPQGKKRRLGAVQTASCGPCKMFLSPFMKAKRSASSENREAASPPPDACCCASSPRHPGAWCSTASPFSTSGKKSCGVCAVKCRSCFRTRTARFNPRMTVGRILAEGLELRGIAGRAERDREAARLLELVQMPHKCGHALSARVFRWAASAHRHRAGSGR